MYKQIREYYNDKTMESSKRDAWKGYTSLYGKFSLKPKLYVVHSFCNWQPCNI